MFAIRDGRTEVTQADFEQGARSCRDEKTEEQVINYQY